MLCRSQQRRRGKSEPVDTGTWNSQAKRIGSGRTSGLSFRQGKVIPDRDYSPCLFFIMDLYPWWQARRVLKFFTHCCNETGSPVNLETTLPPTESLRLQHTDYRPFITTIIKKQGGWTMELKTPLYDAHVKAGGKMVPFAGYILPVQYKAGGVK